MPSIPCSNTNFKIPVLGAHSLPKLLAWNVKINAENLTLGNYWLIFGQINWSIGMLTMRNAFLPVLPVILLLTACNSTPKVNASSSAAQSPLNSSVFYPTQKETRVYLESSCPNAQNNEHAAEFIAAIVPSVIDVAVGSMVAAAQVAAEDKEFSVSSLEYGHFYVPEESTVGVSFNQEVGCLVVVSGEFGNSDNSYSSEISGLKKAEPNLNEYGLTADPVFYGEFFINQNVSRQVFRLDAVYLYTSSNFIDDKKEGLSNDKLLTFDFRIPGSTDAKGTFSSTSLILKELQLGEEYHGKGIEQFTSTWMKLPELEAGIKSKLEKRKEFYSKAAAKGTELCKHGLTSSNPDYIALFCNQYASVTDIDIFAADVIDGSGGQGAQIPPDGNSVAAIDSVEQQPFNISSIKQSFEDVIESQNEYDAQQLAAEVAALKGNEKRAAKNAKAKLDSSNKLLSDQLSVNKAYVEYLKSIQAIGDIDANLDYAGSFELHFNLTETKSGSKFFKAVAKVLEGSKDGLTTALNNKLDPSTKDKLAEEKDKAEEASNVELYNLQLSLLTSENTLATETYKLSVAKTEQEKISAEFAIKRAELEIQEIKRKLEKLED